MTSARGDRRAIGQYGVCSLGSLFGLRMGMIFVVFHVEGMVFKFMILLYKLVKMEIEWYESCFMWIGDS